MLDPCQLGHVKQGSHRDYHSRKPNLADRVGAVNDHLRKIVILGGVFYRNVFVPVFLTCLRSRAHVGHIPLHVCS